MPVTFHPENKNQTQTTPLWLWEQLQPQNPSGAPSNRIYSVVYKIIINIMLIVEELACKTELITLCGCTRSCRGGDLAEREVGMDRAGLA